MLAGYGKSQRVTDDRKKKECIRQIRGVNFFSAIFDGISNKIYVIKNMVKLVDTCTPETPISSRNP